MLALKMDRIGRARRMTVFYLANARNIMTVIADSWQSSDELVMWNTQIINELSIVKVPNQEWKWLLCFITTDAHFSIGWYEQWIEKTILANLFETDQMTTFSMQRLFSNKERAYLEGCFKISSLEVHHVHIHAIPRESNYVIITV